jgi:hypothetical protein
MIAETFDETESVVVESPESTASAASVARVRAYLAT